ncbi:MAG: hypothetical protein ACOWYE_10670 [Desulfatiglandales bacterium]
MKLSEVRDILKATVVVGEEKLDISIEKGAGSDLMSDLLRGPTSGVVLLSGLNNLQVIRTSIVAGVAAVVLVRGKIPDQEMIQKARDHDLPFLSTPFTMFTACGRLFGKGLRGVDVKFSR